MEFASVSDVLPEADTNAAKNLGVFSIANALPQAVAPAILALRTANNYPEKGVYEQSRLLVS